MIQHKIFNTTQELSRDWDTLVNHDLFLQTNYLRSVEEVSPKNIHLYFIGFYKDQKLVGAAVVQLVKLDLNDMFRQHQSGSFKKVLRHSISSLIKGCALVVGNIMHTGQHGIYFDEKELAYPEFLTATQKALVELQPLIKKQYQRRIQIIAFKDYFSHDTFHGNTDYFLTHKFHRLKLQPNMLLEIPKNWASIGDYIVVLTKKYRDRYKRARKKRGALKPVELDLDTIKENSATLHQLYLNVSDNAKFNTFILPENHFYSLKKHLKGQFRLFGYYDQGNLVGFYSLFLNQTDLETYFLGYDEAHQYPNQLYLNMLYDMLDFGIQNSFKTVVYARTAMAIKSSVGAKAEDMWVFMKHTNPVLNMIFKMVFSLVNPKQEWRERHPFK